MTMEEMQKRLENLQLEVQELRIWKEVIEKNFSENTIYEINDQIREKKLQIQLEQEAKEFEQQYTNNCDKLFVYITPRVQRLYELYVKCVKIAWNEKKFSPRITTIFYENLSNYFVESCDNYLKYGLINYKKAFGKINFGKFFKYYCNPKKKNLKLDTLIIDFYEIQDEEITNEMLLELIKFFTTGSEYTNHYKDFIQIATQVCCH